jgi:type II secretory pathway pseudopilin PulG
MSSGETRVARSAAGGYSLVVVVMIIAVMNIAVAIVLPLWAGIVQRDKEEELISRGMQYAEAIRVFQHRFGRLPVQLDELVKVEPRSIRRLWEDPMTGRADWILILEGAPPGSPGAPGVPGTGMVDPSSGKPVPDPSQPSEIDGEPPPQPIGPIRGVRSRATGDAFHIFLDQENYGSWEFRSDIFSRFRGAPSENGIPRISALTIGRPFRYANPGEPQPGTGLPSPSTPPGAPPPGKPRLRSQGGSKPGESK